MQTSKSAMHEVLQKNTEVLEEISLAASELGVVHAVLSTKAPPRGAATDLQQAVERVAVIEKKIDEAAETLEDSNKRLRDSIAGRVQSEP